MNSPRNLFGMNPRETRMSRCSVSKTRWIFLQRKLHASEKERLRLRDENSIYTDSCAQSRPTVDIVFRRKFPADRFAHTRIHVSGRKPALLDFMEEKYAGLAYYAKCTLCTDRCGERRARSFRPGVRSIRCYLSSHPVAPWKSTLHALAHHFEDCRHFLIKIHSTGIG